MAPVHDASGGGPDVRRLFPTAATFGLEHLYAGLTLPTPVAPGGWWVALCMVASLDGAAAADGRSGGLGGRADRLALGRLRGAGDAVLVGAATVREEGYGPLTGTPERQRDRVARGLSAVPRLVILTRSGDLDPASAPFTHPQQRPLVLTSDTAAAAVRRRLGAVADVAVVGEERVELRTALAHLGATGLGRVVCEGGPRVNAQLLADGLVDEVFVTLAPRTVGGEAPRIAQGATGERLERRRLESVHEHEGELLLRYRDPRHPPAPPTPDGA